MTNQETLRPDLDYNCAECGSEIVKIWDDETSQHRWMCSKDNTHNGYQKKLGPQKALARGEADKLLGKGAQKDLENRVSGTMPLLSVIPKQDAGDFTPIDLGKLQGLIQWADSVGLNALLGHVELYFGEPRVSIDGYYYLNNKREKPYRIGTQPMLGRDKDDYQLEPGDYGSIAISFLDGDRLPEIGIGIVKAKELTEESKKRPGQKRYPIVAEHPQRMAEKRAEWQLLRKLVPLEVKE